MDSAACSPAPASSSVRSKSTPARPLGPQITNKTLWLGNPLQFAIVATTTLLTCIGLIAIYAASSLKGSQQFGDEFLFIRKQTLAAGLGFTLLAVIQALPIAAIGRLTLPLLALSTVLLGLIFVPGMYSKVGGASRWLNLPIVGGQPAEIAKLSLVLFLARNLSRPASDLARPAAGILPNLAVYGLLSALLLVQKDLGTPVLMFAVTLAMLYAAGLPRIWFFAVAALFGLVIGVAVIFEPYRVARIMSFLNPWATIKSSGFQIIQSFVAFQNGGLFGSGLGESKQKLFFLPEAHTDFILAVIAEELGLMGVLLVLFAFGYLTYLGYKVTMLQGNPHHRFVAFGLTTLIGLQASLNMGVCMGLLPTKGMTLPFLSSGSSSLLVFLVVSAILARLAREAAPMT